MLPAQIPRFLLTLICLLALAMVCSAQNIKKPAVLNSCEDVFGTSIDTKLNLFEVNEFFVLQPRFDAAADVIELSVLPKYFLQESHPEWSEPEHWPLLSSAEVQNLLARLEAVVPKGKLVATAADSVITNSTGYFLDRYERAYVYRGNVVSGVRFFHVFPFHTMEGYVRKAKHERSVFNEDFYRVLIGQLNYFVDRAQYHKLKRGRTQKLRVVGPIKGYCLGGFCNP